MQRFAAVPALTWHTVPQAPQLFRSLVRLVSQPVAVIPSQLPQPRSQVPMPQVLAEHVAVACAKLQRFMHAPQFEVLLVRFVSQPLDAIPSQLPQPALHPPMAHAPLIQDCVVCARLQTLPHMPQFVALVVTSVSQPLTGLLSQFPCEASQVQVLVHGKAVPGAGHQALQADASTSTHW